MQKNLNLTNKTIIITGSSSGLGLETAKRIASLNNTVIIASRNEKRGRKVEKEIGKNSYFMQLDVLICDLFFMS